MSKGMPYPHPYPIPQACANEAEEEEMRKLVREGENLMRESDKLMTAGGDIQEKNRRLGNKNCGELWDEGARIIRESYDVGRRGYIVASLLWSSESSLGTRKSVFFSKKVVV